MGDWVLGLVLLGAVVGLRLAASDRRAWREAGAATWWSRGLLGFGLWQLGWGGWLALRGLHTMFPPPYAFQPDYGRALAYLAGGGLAMLTGVWRLRNSCGMSGDHGFRLVDGLVREVRATWPEVEAFAWVPTEWRAGLLIERWQLCDHTGQLLLLRMTDGREVAVKRIPPGRRGAFVGRLARFVREESAQTFRERSVHQENWFDDRPAVTAAVLAPSDGLFRA